MALSKSLVRSLLRLACDIVAFRAHRRETASGNACLACAAPIIAADTLSLPEQERYDHREPARAGPRFTDRTIDFTIVTHERGQ